MFLHPVDYNFLYMFKCDKLELLFKRGFDIPESLQLNPFFTDKSEILPKLIFLKFFG